MVDHDLATLTTPVLKLGQAAMDLLAVQRAVLILWKDRLSGPWGLLQDPDAVVVRPDVVDDLLPDLVPVVHIELVGLPGPGDAMKVGTIRCGSRMERCSARMHMMPHPLARSLFPVVLWVIFDPCRISGVSPCSICHHGDPEVLHGHRHDSDADIGVPLGLLGNLVGLDQVGDPRLWKSLLE